MRALATVTLVVSTCVGAQIPTKKPDGPAKKPGVATPAKNPAKQDTPKKPRSRRKNVEHGRKVG